MKIPLMLLLVGVTTTQEACPPKNMPVFNRKIYQGNSETKSLDRKQSGEKISCEDPAFNEFSAMRTDSLTCLQKTYLLHCEKWDGKQEPCALEP